MKFLVAALGLASVANAHTLFTTLFINGKNQGDGTCVRQPKNGDGKDIPSANAPIYPVTGDDMACGRIGNEPVDYICPAPGGASLTFTFRSSPNGNEPGAIAESHLGPCAVYVKKVDDMFSDRAAGGGWFKIWEDGYHPETDTWCVDTLIKNKGLLTVDLPTGLPSGYYLIRPEVLALHSAVSGDPQFYTSCAQIFIENGPEGPLEIPDEYEVSIPGYVSMDDPGLTYNLYQQKPLPEYEIPGPEVYIPSSKKSGSKQTQEDGVIPEDRLIKNANWAAEPIAPYSDQTGCWAAAKSCWDQGDLCWKSSPPSGNANCHIWGDYCSSMNDACSAKNYDGPPKFTAEEEMVALPGPIPQVYGDNFKRTDIDGSGSGSDDEESSSSAAPKATSTTKAAATTAAATTKADDSAPTTQADGNDGPVPTSTPRPIFVTLSEGTDDSSTAADVASTTAAEVASSTSASSPAETSTPSEDGGLKISEDGRCGGTTGQTCQGSVFGDCCSKKGRCGRKTRHCSCGCQPGFGSCRKAPNAYKL